jgi:BioD-like phosphotransacetylase family protein
LGTCVDTGCDIIQEDIDFLAHTLNLSPERIQSPLLYIDSETIQKRLQNEESIDYSQPLKQYVQQAQGDLILLEGGGNLWDGNLYNLSVGQTAELVDAQILLVVRYHSLLLIDSLLAAKQYLGDRLLGVTINHVPHSDLELVQQTLVPYLESQDMPVFGIIPSDRLLESVSVRELAHRLNAKILCRNDRLDLMVESLTIGAMNVNAALGYFQQRHNMVVVTGGDRTDLQLAALETSTNCLILTGHLPPQDFILSRAEDLEVPILSVDSDTLTTVEIVDQAFGRTPLREPIKVEQIKHLMGQHFDILRLMQSLGLKPPVTA